MESDTVDDEQHGRGAGAGMLLGLAAFTLFGMGGLGVLLMAGVQQRSLALAVLGDRSVLFHGVLGLGSGILIGGLAWLLIAQRFMDPVRQKYAYLIGPLMPHSWMRITVSLCAGVGEELLFRGAVQHWLGIPITAVVFVALHGYLDPRSWRISLYGAVLTLAMMGIGWMAKAHGLLAPMVAHTVIDIILLERLHAAWRKARAL